MRVNENKLLGVEQMDHGVGQKLGFGELLLQRSTNHLPIYLKEALIIFILAVLLASSS